MICYDCLNSMHEAMDHCPLLFVPPTLILHLSCYTYYKALCFSNKSISYAFKKITAF